MNDKQAMIEKLQTTWTAFGGLSKEEQEFLKLYSAEGFVGFINGDGGYIPTHAVMYKGLIYRLSCDFKLPDPERWWYSKEEHRLFSNKVAGKIEGDPNLTEIHADDVEYVKAMMERKDIDLNEWEYRVPKIGDLFVSAADGNDRTADINCMPHVLRFVRKPAKARFVEYPITIREGKFYECGVVHIPDHCSIHELPSIVGFTGEIKFQFPDGSIAWGHEFAVCTSDGIPATPIAARFYVKESK